MCGLQVRDVFAEGAEEGWAGGVVTFGEEGGEVEVGGVEGVERGGEGVGSGFGEVDGGFGVEGLAFAGVVVCGGWWWRVGVLLVLGGGGV